LRGGARYKNRLVHRGTAINNEQDDGWVQFIGDWTKSWGTIFMQTVFIGVGGKSYAVALVDVEAKATFPPVELPHFVNQLTEGGNQDGWAKVAAIEAGL
jgi:hypothetical protein